MAGVLRPGELEGAATIDELLESVDGGGDGESIPPIPSAGEGVVDPAQAERERLGEFTYGQESREVRALLAVVQAQENAAEALVVPKGATHRFISGEFTGTYVKFDSFSYRGNYVRVQIVDGPRAGSMMNVSPDCLALGNGNSPDEVLANQLKEGQESPYDIGPDDVGATIGGVARSLQVYFGKGGRGGRGGLKS